MLSFWCFLVLKRSDFDKVLTVKCQGVSNSPLAAIGLVTCNESLAALKVKRIERSEIPSSPNPHTNFSYLALVVNRRNKRQSKKFGIDKFIFQSPISHLLFLALRKKSIVCMWFFSAWSSTAEQQFSMREDLQKSGSNDNSNQCLLVDHYLLTAIISCLLWIDILIMF